MSFILKNWQFIGIGLLLAVIAGLFLRIEFLKSDSEKLEAEKSSLITRLEVSQQSVKDLSSAIEDQNRAVEEFKQAAERRAAESQEALADARRRADRFRANSGEIIRFIPDPNKTECENVTELFNQEILRAKK